MIADVSKAEITVGTQETATVVTNNSVKQRASKYLVGKDDLVNAATKRKNDKISFFKKMNIKTSKRQPKQNRHPYPKKKVDEKTGFLRDMENKNVKPTGKTYTKPFSYDAQNVINQALEPYKQQGAILQMNDLHTIVRQEVAPDGLLHGIDGIPKKINVNTYNEFYTKLTEAINAGNSNAQKFFDKYLKNLLTPDSMVVFDTNISIPGSRNPMKIAMSVEKLAAAQSNKNIVILRTNDGLKMVNAHQLKNLGYQIEKLVKGNISAVFQLNNNRLMVITEWDKNNHAIRLILERDERKGVNVIVSAYKGSREDVVKKLSRELYKPLYVDEKTASIINGL